MAEFFLRAGELTEGDTGVARTRSGREIPFIVVEMKVRRRGEEETLALKDRNAVVTTPDGIVFERRSRKNLAGNTKVRRNPPSTQ